MIKTLDKLDIGNSAEIISIDGKKDLRHHFLEMGLTPGTPITLVKTAPMGDPLEIKVRDYTLTLRKSDAAKIEISEISEFKCRKKRNKRLNLVDHPQLGEWHHPKRKNCEHGICEKKHYKQKISLLGSHLRFALVGNQNSGKTTLFNQLTGANQHVGNFPGVTVEHKEGQLRGYPSVKIIDLPGIYSLSPYSTEEIVTRDFIIKEKPNAIINILDATNLERNLYLTMQLLELKVPMVIALNMMDEVRDNHGNILINNLEEILGVPVIPISASKNEGIQELVHHAVTVAKFKINPKNLDLCNNLGTKEEQAIHRGIHSILHIIEDHALSIGVNPRFAATKAIEQDRLMIEALNLDENEKDTIEHIVKQIEEETKVDRVSAIVNMRFSFIENLCENTVEKPEESKAHRKSRKIDKYLTGKYTAIPIFLGIIALMFWMTFSVLGPILSTGLEYLINDLTKYVDLLLTNLKINPVVHSLVIDGIFAGVGSVLSFLPLIVVLFFFLSLMEDSGYMARVAFIMDKLLRKIGLSGKSFVPMLIGFGCSVPAIMSTRTLSSNRDRRMTMFLIPYMSCSAKLPIYVMLTSAFFPKHQGLVIIGLYLLGIAFGIIFALFMKETRFKGEPIPFVMELPNYRLPSFKSVILLSWEKAKDFITKAFTIIFVASVVIWFLQHFDVRLNVVHDSSKSLLAGLGNLIAPLLAPLGLNDWRLSTALITGLMAKESVVSTIAVLLGPNETIHSLLSPATAFVFLVFTLYYTPCVAAMAAFKRETNSTWLTIGMVIVQCAIAWLIAFIFYLILV
ncbi:MAG: ferrous iron transport protein B [Fusobacterium sp. JB021]|nr:ferrous iron transport protein B [Fusobacterium sp. JB021]MDP0505794.1 ferrous iron transport protein B [Fusobacterium sp. JB019]